MTHACRIRERQTGALSPRSFEERDVLCDLRGHVYLTSSAEVGTYGQSSSRSIDVFAASACSTVRNMPCRSLPPLMAKKRCVVPASCRFTMSKNANVAACQDRS